jgi:pyruvate formate lyase activating enzyme
VYLEHDPGKVEAGFLEDHRIQCDVCPRYCKLHEGQRGLCFVRAPQGDHRPIEKKPFNHFLPGTPVLSFGTAGCNLTCKFCQNWDISKARNFDRIQDLASPGAIAEAALRSGCRSVAFTYNDPVIFLEYAVDVAQACRERGIKTVAVGAGYISPEPRIEFFRHMDAANIDLKGFTEGFYKNLCSGKLAPVLETLEYLKRQTFASPK